MNKFIKYGPCYWSTNNISNLEFSYDFKLFKQFANRKKINEFTEKEFKELPIWNLEIHFNDKNSFLLNEKPITFKECEMLAESFIKFCNSDEEFLYFNVKKS